MFTALREQIGRAYFDTLDAFALARGATTAGFAAAMNNPMVAQVKQKIDAARRLKARKGRVVLVDFWATWCASCKAELPNVKAVYAKYHDRGLGIVGGSGYRAT